MITRRKFLKTTAITAIGAVIIPRFLNAAPVHQAEFGLQLYTVRDLLQADLIGILRKIRKIGYTWLEAADYKDGQFYGMAPEELKKKLKSLGLKMVSSHTSFSADKQKQAIEAHKKLGVEYIVFPGFPVPEHDSRDDYLRAAARLNAIGEACNKEGMKLGYHNHAFEFVKFDDEVGYDILLNNTDPGKVCFESDIYWMEYAGADPLSYFVKYPERFDLWHVKDMKDSPDRGFTEVGTGIIPYPEIFKSAGQAGMKYFFVEQDECEVDPLESIEISCNNLQNILSLKDEK